MHAMAKRVWVPLVVGAAALMLLVGGLVVFLSGRGPADFGWYAYAPLTDSGSFTGFDGVVMWSHRQLAGAGLVVLDLVLVAGTAGFLLRRRRPSTR